MNNQERHKRPLKSWLVRLLVAVVGVLLAAIAVPAQTPRFAYVANNGSNNISAYTIDPGTGALTEIPISVTTDDTGNFLFAANEGSGTMSAYAINADWGTLTPLAPATFRTATQPRSVATVVIP